MRQILSIFSLDKRSLGLFRILIGTVALLDTLHKLSMAQDFYTAEGLMPREHWVASFMNPWHYSFHLAHDALWFQQVLILIQAGAALAFTLGWKARWSNLILYIFMSSLQARNYLILSSADQMLRVALFWSLFLPTGDRFALDKRNNAKSSILNVGSAALLLQLAFVYIFTGLLKWHPVWTQEFSAVYYALNADSFATPLGVVLREYGIFTKAATMGTMLLELGGPIVVLLSTRWLRFAASLAFMSFHFGIFLTMELGFFSFVAIVYWSVVWPTVFWESKAGTALENSLHSVFERLREKWNFGEAPRMPNPRRETVLQGVALFFLFIVTHINLGTIDRDLRPPKVLKQIAHLADLNQKWSMFAPYPLRNDGWFVIRGKFQNGDEKDLLSGQDPDPQYRKPPLVSAMYSSSEWRKWYLNLYDRQSRKALVPFSRYLCKKFSRKNGMASSLEKFKIEFVKERTPPPGASFQTPKIQEIWSYDCKKRKRRT